MAEKVSKPKSLNSKEDIEQALLWLDAKLDDFGEHGISVSNRSLFTPKRLFQKLTGLLWARQCVQFDNHVVVSPFLGELEASTGQDMLVQEIEYGGLLAYCRELTAVAEARYANAQGEADHCREAANAPIEIDASNLEGLDEVDRESVKSHDESVARGHLVAQAANADVDAAEWASLLDRSRKVSERAEASVEAAQDYVRANYCRQANAHLKWALRTGRLKAPYVLPGVLGDGKEVQ